MPVELHTTKARVVAAIDTAWRDFHGALAHLTPEETQTPGACGHWSVKDILGHIASWEARSLAALLSGMPEDPPDTDEFNRIEAARKSPLPLHSLFAELEGTHRALQSALADAPENLFEPGTPFRESLDANTFSHYIEHTAQIRIWANARRHSHPNAHPHR
ncbi:MAG: maleylpyruvate isomerase family mycothiol-dependent enzyme [Gemmatimonadetes bacterium]|nr:maleylpyruvate isomerase family mycothiol-dependent enzyme [Gemmatimonadota bacterium]